MERFTIAADLLSPAIINTLNLDGLPATWNWAKPRSSPSCVPRMTWTRSNKRSSASSIPCHPPSVILLFGQSPGQVHAI